MAGIEKVGELTRRQIRLDSSNVPVISNNVKFKAAGKYPYGTVVVIKKTDGEPVAEKYVSDSYTAAAGDVFGIVSDNQNIEVTDTPVIGNVYLSGVFAKDAIEEITGKISKGDEIVMNAQLIIFSKHL